KSISREMNQLRKRVELLEERLDAAKESESTILKEQLEDLQTRRKKAAEEAVEYIEELEEKELSVEAGLALEEALKRTKAGLFNGFILELRDKINHNLRELTSGDYHCKLIEEKGELGFGFINGLKDEYLPYHSFSEGEKVRIAKSCSMALNDMLNVGFLFDDEGLNNLDGQGARDVLQFIHSQGSGKSIFFVSHSATVKDYFTAARNIHVIKEDGVSSVEVR